METGNYTWRSILNELNNFGCKIEFLQSRIRMNVILQRNLNIVEYLSSIKDLLIKHEINLNKVMRNDLNKDDQAAKKNSSSAVSGKIIHSEFVFDKKEVYN